MSEEFNRQMNFNQNGNQNTQIAHAENVYINCQLPLPVPSNIDYDYYNLFVTADSEFRLKPNEQSGTILIRFEKKLQLKHTIPDIRNQILPLCPKTKVRVRSFPSIFAAESKLIDGYSNDIEPEQEAYIGYIQEMIVQDDIIKITFSKHQTVYQTNLMELSDSLCLMNKPRFNELEKAHWAIKNVNLKQIFPALNF